MKYGNKEFETVSFQIEKSILDKIEKESNDANITFAEWMHLKLKEIVNSPSKTSNKSTSKTELLAFKEALDQANEAYLKLTKDVSAIKKKLNGGISSKVNEKIEEIFEQIDNNQSKYQASLNEIQGKLDIRESWHNDHDESLKELKERLEELEGKDVPSMNIVKELHKRIDEIETPSDSLSAKEIREINTRLEIIEKTALAHTELLEDLQKEDSSNIDLQRAIRDFSIRLSKLEDKNTPYLSDLKEQIDDNQSQITKISKSHETDRQGFVNSINSIEQRLSTMVTSNAAIFNEIEQLKKFRWYKPWTW